MTAPLLVGSMSSYFFLGAYFVQLLQYISLARKHKERTAVHVIVGLTTTIELLQHALMMHTIYEMFIVRAGNYSFVNTPWSSAALPALNGLVAFLVQIFRIWRVHAFMKSIWGTEYITPFIFLVCFLQCGAAVAATVLFVRSGNNAEQLSFLKPAMITWLSLTIVCDTLVTASIVLPLLKRKSTSECHRSQKIINGVILNAVENGSITLLFAIPYLVVFLKFPNTMLAVPFEYVIGRLYANVLLATLNGRERVKDPEINLNTSGTHTLVFEKTDVESGGSV